MMAQNIKVFDDLTTRILTFLLDNFPISQTLRAEDFFSDGFVVENTGNRNSSDLIASGPTIRKPTANGFVFGYTVRWLLDEGFLRLDRDSMPSRNILKFDEISITKNGVRAAQSNCSFIDFLVADHAAQPD